MNFEYKYLMLEPKEDNFVDYLNTELSTKVFCFLIEIQQYTCEYKDSWGYMSDHYLDGGIRVNHQISYVMLDAECDEVC